MRRVASLFVTIGFLAVSSVAFAHPPTSVTVTYDKDKKTVQAVVVHGVGSPTRHYIKKVAISVNGTSATVLTFDHQDSKESQKAEYVLPAAAKPGDVIAVKATCNIFGSKEGSLTVQ